MEWLNLENKKNVSLIYFSFLTDDNSTFSDLTTEQSPENSSPETSLRELSALHPMVYQLPVSSPYRPTTLLTPTTCGLLVSPEAAAHLVVSTPLESSSKQLDSPPASTNLEKLPSISTTMWWPLPQQKWIAGLSQRLCTWSSLSRWSWSRLWAFERNRTDLSGSSFVDRSQRLPPPSQSVAAGKILSFQLLLVPPKPLKHDWQPRSWPLSSGFIHRSLGVITVIVAIDLLSHWHSMHVTFQTSVDSFENQ